MTKHDWLPDATLIVGTSFSHCNNCGRGALPHEHTHGTEAGYGGRGAGFGCGILFEYVTTFYLGAEEASRRLRPDLKYVNNREEVGA